MPDQTTHDPDLVEVNAELLEHYKDMIAIRRKHSALQDGTYKTWLASDEYDIFGFFREDDAERILVIFNNGSEPAEIHPPGEWNEAENACNRAPLHEDVATEAAEPLHAEREVELVVRLELLLLRVRQHAVAELTCVGWCERRRFERNK